MSVSPEPEPQVPDTEQDPGPDPAAVDLPLSANLAASTDLAADKPAEQ